MSPEDILTILYSPLLINIYGLLIAFGRVTVLMQTKITLWGYFFVAFPLFGAGAVFGGISENGNLGRADAMSLIAYAIAVFGYVWLLYAMYKDHIVFQSFNRD